MAFSQMMYHPDHLAGWSHCQPFSAWIKRVVFIFLGRIAPKGFGEITNSKYQITNGWRVDFNKLLQLVHAFVAFIASCEAELLLRWVTKRSLGTRIIVNCLLLIVH